jgi:hypothetical protein
MHFAPEIHFVYYGNLKTYCSLICYSFNVLIHRLSFKFSFLFSPFHFFCLLFYCLFPFFGLIFYRPSFPPSFCHCFSAHVVLTLVYPNLFRTKRLGCCCRRQYKLSLDHWTFLSYAVFSPSTMQRQSTCHFLFFKTVI